MNDFILWCNRNSGFFSLLLSAIAIIISIHAIHAQNKGAVFKERLEIYTYVLDMYERSCRIVAKCRGISIHRRKAIIAIIIFDIGSREQDIVEEYYKEKALAPKSNNHKIQKTHLLMEYLDIYLKKYNNDSMITKASIFYKSAITDSIKKMYNIYDTLRLNLLIYEENEIDALIQELDDILVEIHRKHILKKMRRHLPI